MEQDQFCNILCLEHFKSHDVQAFKAIIKEEYHHNWIIDNLPVKAPPLGECPGQPSRGGLSPAEFPLLAPLLSLSFVACLLLVSHVQAASILDSEQYITTTYAGGFPVGYQEGSRAYIFNHVNIIVEYHPLDVRRRAWKSPSLESRPLF